MIFNPSYHGLCTNEMLHENVKKRVPIGLSFDNISPLIKEKLCFLKSQVPVTLHNNISKSYHLTYVAVLNSIDREGYS